VAEKVRRWIASAVGCHLCLMMPLAGPEVEEYKPSLGGEEEEDAK
jgi:hypothetical protein